MTTDPIRPSPHYPFADCPSLRPLLRPRRADDRRPPAPRVPALRHPAVTPTHPSRTPPPTSTSRRPLIPHPMRHRPSPPRSHSHTPLSHIQDNSGLQPAKEKKKGDEETGGGDSPPMQHPREGLPTPKLCLSITPKPAAAQGALGAACRTAAARGLTPEDEWS